EARRPFNRHTARASALDDPRDRNTAVDTVFRRVLRRGWDRPGRRAGDLLWGPRPQRGGQVDDDQDGDGTARPFGWADDRAGSGYARSPRGARGQAADRSDPRGPRALRLPDGAGVPDVRGPHPPDAPRDDPQPLQRAARTSGPRR